MLRFSFQLAVMHISQLLTNMLGVSMELGCFLGGVMMATTTSHNVSKLAQRSKYSDFRIRLLVQYAQAWRMGLFLRQGTLKTGTWFPSGTANYIMTLSVFKFALCYFSRTSNERILVPRET